MYIPSSFHETNLAILHQTMAQHPFATLISTGDDGIPFITHLPLLVDTHRGDRGTLIGHVARANPHAAVLSTGRPTIAVFHGPHAYVSPTWYNATPSVPTWNYVAVHAGGVPRELTSEHDVHDLLSRTTAEFEPPGSAYGVDALPPLYLSQMAKAVLAFEMPIDRIEGKFKLSQNRSIADRRGVIEALSGSDDESRRVAELMRSREMAR